MLVPLVLALAYSVGSKLLSNIIGVRRLKDKLLVKNVVISFGWSLIPVLVGLYYRSLPLVVLSLGPFIFFRLMANTNFFELRDSKADETYGVRTIPVTYGVVRTYSMMNYFDLFSAVYIIALVAIDFLPLYTLVMIILPLYSVAYRAFSKDSGAIIDYLCEVVADGEYLLWGPLLFIGKIF